jgi:hypothetical protein
VNPRDYAGMAGLEPLHISIEEVCCKSFSVFKSFRLYAVVDREFPPRMVLVIDPRSWAMPCTPLKRLSEENLRGDRFKDIVDRLDWELNLM